MFKKVLVVAGIGIVVDITYLIIKNLKSRFDTSYDLLLFGEKFTCKKSFCRDSCCSFHNKSKIALVLQSAQHSIDVCMYMMTNKYLCAYLLAAHNRGINVRIIVDIHGGFNLSLRTLQKAGVNIGWTETNKDYVLMHHKFCIIDGHVKSQNFLDSILDKFLPPVKKSKLITGSLNWTDSAMSGNYENALVTNDPEVVHLYQDMFDSIAGEFGFTVSKTSVANQTLDNTTIKN